MQIGNAVPPLFAEAIAGAIKDSMRIKIIPRIRQSSLSRNTGGGGAAIR